jgi:TetR/AcrR family transcriptional repressor of mexJK operon
MRGKQPQVLDAAVELFLANGFDQTSMDAIAARAGVSKSTVYAHYADKVALFRAVVERSAVSLALELDHTRLLVTDDAEAKLTQIILNVLEATTAPEFLAFLRVIITENTRQPDLARAVQGAGYPDVIGLIAEALEEQAANRGYSLSDPRMFATLLLRMAVSSPQIDSLLFAKFRPTPSLLEAHARWVLTVFLRGIEPRERGGGAVAPPDSSYHYPWLPDTAAQAPDF